MSDGYQPQLNPGAAVETSFAGAPGDWGSGITQGLESAGNSVDEAIHQVKDKQRDAEATQAGVQFAQNATNLDNAAIALRQQAGPGGAGHTDNVNAAIDQTSAQAIASIGDRKVRQAFQDRYAQLKQSLGTREYGWQAGKSVEKMATDFDDAGSTWADHAASTGDPHVLADALPAIEATGRALSVNPDLQDKLIKEQKEKVAMAWAGAAVRLNPTQLIGDAATGQKGVLDNPDFVGLFQKNPQAIDALRHQAEVQIAHNQMVQEHNANQQKAAVLSRIGLFNTQLTAGHVASPDEFQSLITDAKAAGLPKDALELEDKQDVSAINQKYEGMPPAIWHRDIAALQQKVTAAGDKATDYDRMHLKNLIAQSSPAIEKFNADPQAFAATTPHPAPAVDWSSADPAALQNMGQARVAWANTFAPTNGIVNPASVMLNADEKKQFSDGLKGGDAMQLETLKKLQSAFGPTVAGQVAEHLMPGDKNLKFLSSLNDRGMALYTEGLNATNNKLVHLGAEGNTPDAVADRQAVKDGVTYWQDAIPGDMQGAFMNVTPKIAAGVAHETGNRSPTGDELKSVVANAVQRISGLQGDAQHGYTGGFAMWKTGPVWLPQGMSHDDFAHRMTVAGPDDWVKAAGGHPFYVGPNGKPTPLDPGHMGQLGNYKLVPTGAGNGIYALADPNGARLKQHDGRTDWTFNIRNLR